MDARGKPLVWLHGQVKTPPFSQNARIEAGFLWRRVQRGENLAMPHSRPMPAIGSKCHELRITDYIKIWRIIYRVDLDQAKQQQRHLTQMDLAKLLKSSQSRVANMEAVDPSVSLDLLVRSLLAMGATREALAQLISSPGTTDN